MLDLTHESARGLHNALLANAVFSTFCALFIIFAHNLVLGWLGVALNIRVLGFALLLFAVYLVWMSRSTHLPRHLVTGVIAGDWAWVVGSVVLVAIKYTSFSTFGVFLTLDIALVVGVFALLQGRGLKRASCPFEPDRG